ncbi:MAG TPA: ROK family transcriptional regulator [Pseudonocardiaceae bacterium]|nr:ROK family transcriptional regulator [Pseudonocardiaceae bacterium]
MPTKGDQGTVRALNRRLLLRLLREQGPTSRTDLAEASGLSNGAVTRIVGELIEEGFLVVQSVGMSTGGRRPVLLDLDTTGRVVAGLKLMDDAILAVLVDLKGTVIAHSRTALRSHDHKVVLARAAKAVERLLDGIEATHDRLAGVGLCMPGTIDWETGVCQVAPFFNWQNVHVGELLHDLTGVPVAVDNDVNALAVAESLFGRGRTVRDFAVITIGRGVGAGLVTGGRVYRGANGGAGEFGHVVSELGGRHCECGKNGCLEAYVGEQALLGLVREQGKRYVDVDIDAFLDLVAADDRVAAPIHAEALTRLGAAIANLVNLLNPELVVLGGESAMLTDEFLAALRPRITEHAFGDLADGLEIQLDELRNDPTAWARGAASLAMEHIFDPLMSSMRSTA